MDDELSDRLSRAQLLPRLAAQELLRQQQQQQQQLGRNEPRSSKYVPTPGSHGRNRPRQSPDGSTSFADDEADMERHIILPHGAELPPTLGWLDEVIQNVATAPAGKQIAIGGISGLCSGYIVSKVGKTAILALGGGLIIIQVAHYQGLIQVNWRSIEESVATTRRQITQQVNDNMPALTNFTRDLVRRHVFLASSFGIGFLLGLVV